MHIQSRKALNKAFLKIKPNRDGIELFKNNLKLLLDKIKLIDSRPKDETEEHLKNDLRDFLRDTYYKESNAINTKDKKDLVIHHGKNTNSNVAIIIEAKRPSNKSEMFSVDNVNCKALQELILYFLRERISNKNLSITNLIITNVTKWFLFEAQLFDKLFAQNKSLVKQFEDFEAGKLSGKNTDFFYKEIAKPFIETLIDKLEYTYFDLATYDKILRNDDKQDDAKLIVLYKLLSPEHLLKLSFANDSNSLDKNFYNELLHLIGLTETKEGGKKLIERPKSGQRHAGSLLENVINQLDSLDKISRLPNVKQYGDTHEERLFTVGLELCITWVNRILFLKLLEAQLISYHKGDKSYAFLHKDLLHDYDNLNALFFMVLAKKPEERNDRVKTPFAKVPYLNSSLFEPTDLEHQALLISSLENGISLPFISATVIKDANGKKLTGERNAIDYFFDFLDAYDFASEGSEDIQEDNKTLINASVLGLIFEKINGYKDGSFYTPSFITMYMCKETIRRAVVQKFNETKGWNCEDFDALYNKIDDTQEANAIINSVKICDPAVGSGHFLVSALNEMIAIKHDLKVLTDREGKRLKEYQVDILNDELIVTDEDGVPFTYNPKSKESQRLQETLFHEKQTIIENCLFGVDINPNSVKICRLRLWIELLKNAYYRNETELETLPNIDINIKCGNSLIARFGLDADLKEALQKSKLKIDDYKRAVDQYRNAESKEQKREMELLIAEIKTGFSSNIDNPFKDKIKKARWEVNKYETEINTKEQWGDKIEKSLLKEFDIAKKKFQKLEDEQEEIKSNKIYENAFEWRFEFPEVLNDEGDFVGFDVVIGNPPYFQLQYSGYSKIDYFNSYELFEKTGDIYSLFFEKSDLLIKDNGIVSFITSNRFCNTNYGKSTRKYLSDRKLLSVLNINNIDIFDEANVGTIIVIFQKSFNHNNKFKCYEFKNLNEVIYLQDTVDTIESDIEQIYFNDEQWVFASNKVLKLKNKITSNTVKLSKIDEIKINRGITTGSNSVFLVKNEFAENFIQQDKIYSEILKPVLKGAEIKRYVVKPNQFYILLTKTGVNIENYPLVYNYLVENKKELDNVYETKKGMKKWYELRKCSYYDSFEKEKLIWTRLSAINSFAISTNSEYSIDSTSFATGNNLKFYCSILNSKVIYFYFKLGSVIWGSDGIKWFGEYFDSIPIPIIDSKEQKVFIDKVDQILSLKKDNPEADTTALEREIDFMVYELYGLTQEEIEIVENS
jgi:hypothetical protein